MDAAAGGTEVYEGDYTVDTTTDPKQLTGLITASSVPDYVGKTTNGIYEIVGDDLSFAANEPGDPRRPTSFEPGTGARIFQLTRQ